MRKQSTSRPFRSFTKPIISRREESRAGLPQSVFPSALILLMAELRQTVATLRSSPSARSLSFNPRIRTLMILRSSLVSASKFSLIGSLGCGRKRVCDLACSQTAASSFLSLRPTEGLARRPT